MRQSALLAIGAAVLLSGCDDALESRRLARLERGVASAARKMAVAESTLVAARQREDWTFSHVENFRRFYPDSQVPRRLTDAHRKAERARAKADTGVFVAYRRQQVAQRDLQNWLAGR